MAHRSFHADAASAKRESQNTGAPVSPLAGPDGFPTGVIHGCLRTLLGLRERHKDADMIAIFDSGRPQRRLDLLPSYKGNRPKSDPSLADQIQDLFEILPSFGIPTVKEHGVEADDIIISFAGKARHDRVIIVGDDKDLGQAVTDRVFQLKSPKTRGAEWALHGPDDIKARLGVPPEFVPDYLALTGDSSDNIPGAPGVGATYAVKFITAFGGIDNILANADRIEPERFRKILSENAELIRTCLTITRPLTCESEVPTPVEPDHDRVSNYLAKRGLRSIAAKFFGAEPLPKPVPSKPKPLYDQGILF